MYAAPQWAGAGYASLPEVQALKGSAFLRKERQRLNLVAIVQNVIAPWLLFCLLYGVMSFFVHYKHPSISWFIAVVCLLPALAAGCFAFRATMGRARQQARQWSERAAQLDVEKPVDPSWLYFFCAALGAAWILAMIFGDINYYWNLQPYYDLEILNTYPNVDPHLMQGKEMMDGGRVFFTKESKLDLTKSMAFKNVDTYCVAPIVSGSTIPVSYDFWTVGMNCCSGNQNDFHCGEFNNPRAKAGLRLMYDDQRPFYRLAVQQAEAMYNIKSTHPLFFHWMEDPDAAVSVYWQRGMRWYLVGILGHFFFSLLCVACATVFFSKMNYL